MLAKVLKCPVRSSGHRLQFFLFDLFVFIDISSSYLTSFHTFAKFNKKILLQKACDPFSAVDARMPLTEVALRVERAPRAAGSSQL